MTPTRIVCGWNATLRNRKQNQEVNRKSPQQVDKKEKVSSEASLAVSLSCLLLAESSLDPSSKTDMRFIKVHPQHHMGQFGAERQ